MTYLIFKHPTRFFNITGGSGNRWHPWFARTTGEKRTAGFCRPTGNLIQCEEKKPQQASVQLGDSFIDREKVIFVIFIPQGPPGIPGDLVRRKMIFRNSNFCWHHYRITLIPLCHPSLRWFQRQVCPFVSLARQGPPGPAGPKGQRGERVRPSQVLPKVLRLSTAAMIWSVCVMTALLCMCLHTQGEPGYIIASPDAHFVPGRKGEPGSLVGLQKNKTWMPQCPWNRSHITGCMLQGPQGPPGVPGANGSPGPVGPQGPKGSPGIYVKVN